MSTVGDLLAASRSSSGHSLHDLARRLTAASGKPVSRQLVSEIEKGREPSATVLRALAEVCVGELDLPDALRGPWRRLLCDPEGTGAGLPATPPVLRAALVRSAGQLTGNPRWDRYRTLAAADGMDLDANVREARRRLALPEPAAGAWSPVATDAVEVDLAGSVLTVTVDHGELFTLRAHLRNRGPVGWTDRLLVRLGAQVSSSLAFTPPVLSVPDTPPGGTCRLSFPGRAPWFPNLTVVTYVMTFPDCRPAVDGNLTLYVDATDRDGITSHPLPPAVETQLRRRDAATPRHR